MEANLDTRNVQTGDWYGMPPVSTGEKLDLLGLGELGDEVRDVGLEEGAVTIVPWRRCHLRQRRGREWGRRGSVVDHCHLVIRFEE